MNLLRDAPIRRKMTILMLVTSAIVLVAACSALFWYQSNLLRQSITRSLSTLSNVIAAQSTAAVTFSDRQAAGELLKALKEEPQIVGAQLRAIDGTVIASYGQYGEAGTLVPEKNGLRFGERFLYLTQPVALDNEEIATLSLKADFQTAHGELLGFYARLLAGVVLVSMLLIMLLANIFHPVITAPVLKLAMTASRVAESKDYSLRAEILGQDEIGRLSSAFNGMLYQIQAQDSELKESRERFELAVAGSRDGLWDWDVATNQVFYSPRWKSMLGYEEGEIQAAFDEFTRLLHPDDRSRVMEKLNAYFAGDDQHFEAEFRLQGKDGDYGWVVSRGVALRDAEGKPYRMAGSHTDITERKLAEQELDKLNRQLVDISRQAGMADIATGVLHNVGNVLNSVNVSATLVIDGVKQQEIHHLAKAIELLNEHSGQATEFLSQNPRGQMLLGYVTEFVDQLGAEREEHIGELTALTKNIEHIKEIVAMQQSYAKVSGATGTFDLVELVEDALKINLNGFERHQVRIVREYEPTPLVFADRHKTLQIIINLLSNAKHALDRVNTDDKTITIQVGSRSPARVQIVVTDNGIGIARENLVNIFNFGYTTRSEGHGFGLHSGANAAKEMGGTLSVFSAGPGTGARFTLELPVAEARQSQIPVTEALALG